MIPSRLTAFVFSALLCPAVFAATAAGTGPPDPTPPRAPVINSAPGMNTDGSGVPLINQPPATGTDPRTQGSDPGRQGGMNTPTLPPRHTTRARASVRKPPPVAPVPKDPASSSPTRATLFTPMKR